MGVGEGVSACCGSEAGAGVGAGTRACCGSASWGGSFDGAGLAASEGAGGPGFSGACRPTFDGDESNITMIGSSCDSGGRCGASHQIARPTAPCSRIASASAPGGMGRGRCETRLMSVTVPRSLNAADSAVRS